jgi:hypothetical protein
VTPQVEATIIKAAVSWALFIAERRPKDSDPETNLRRLEKYFQDSYEFLAEYGNGGSAVADPGGGHGA